MEAFILGIIILVSCIPLHNLIVDKTGHGIKFENKRNKK